MKHLLLAVTVALLALSAFSLSIEGPGAVYITGASRTVDYTISNSSSAAVSVNLSMVSPAHVTLSRSIFTVPSRDSVAFSVTIESRADLENQSYVSTLVAQTPDTIVTKRVELSFKPQPAPNPNPGPAPNPSPDFNQNSMDSNQASTGLFALSFNPNLGAWMTTENLLNAILLILAAILFIALISRLAKLTR